ncbi:MAG: hypothetical protein ACE5GE_09485 [Phycisphaerae bacterium]
MLEGAVGGTVKRSLAVEVALATAWLRQTVPPVELFAIRFKA